MTARFTRSEKLLHKMPVLPPLASAETWAARKPPAMTALQRAAEELYDMVLAADNPQALAESMDVAQQAIFSANEEINLSDIADETDISPGNYRPRAPLHAVVATTADRLAASILQYFDSYKLATIAPIIVEIEKAFDVERKNAELETIHRANDARRDQAAADYGEPETPHEFYAGRPGSQAETIVLDCLRKLQTLPEIDRVGADQLMDVIARDYLATALDAKTNRRRVTALLHIAGEKV